MWKKIFFWIILCYCSGLLAQEKSTLYQTKKIAPTKDTIRLEKTSINSSFFKVLDSKGKAIDSTLYRINFSKSTLLLLSDVNNLSDSITVEYLQYPDFLTKTYTIYDPGKVVSNAAGQATLYSIAEPNLKKNIPFDGLSTSGSITRGVTIGNNQNAVLNSNLDLQITGKLSDKVSIRASLQDSNIPLQDGGYSQQLDQFDTVFMELFGNNWSVRAGDLFLDNKASQFLTFNKKVQGIATTFNWERKNNKSNVFAAAALVRGQYAKSDIIGQEGNQGPYKLRGQNGELYVLIVSGSERVYVNGNLLERGENKDYTIDYNAGEIIFTPLFTITSEMRIAIEYQYTDRNYSRFVTYAGGTHESKKWRFGGYLYSENDLKNQPVQQNLSQEQVQIIKNAGDDTRQMTAPSAFLDSYSDNKVLYKQILVDGVLVYEYTTDKEGDLYNVRFSLVGANAGNYILSNTNTISRVFAYVAPINGIPQGNYEPIVQLIAPNKVQVASFVGQFHPTEKTNIDVEIGVSNNDQNLFSALDDANNKGLAAKIKSKQRLFSKGWNMDAVVNYQFIESTFKTVERLNNIEFNRDWNLEPLTTGNQSLLVTGLQLQKKQNPKSTSIGNANYQLEKLDFAGNFTGNRHVVNGFLQHKNWNIRQQGSYLQSESNILSSSFLRNQSQVRYRFKKNWISTSLRLENNSERNKNTQQLSVLSQKFIEYGGHIGRGDSTKVFFELGYLKRKNDSLQNGMVQRVNQSNTFVLKSRLIQTKTSDLSVVANYRTLDFEANNRKRESTLNSRLIYSDRFFNSLLLSNTVYETTSGSIPQQEFTYLEVAVGQGVYTWNDYNGNGIQELQEFEIAPFIDQAKFIRVFLPNRIFIKTHQNKFSQALTFNPTQWQNEKGFKKFASYFYNQIAFLLDRKIKNNGSNFEWNPFSPISDEVLGLTSSLRNTLYYNRGKQKHSVTYTYLLNKTRSLLSIGSQESENTSHQLQYNHLYQKSWLFGFFTKTIQNKVDSEDFIEKNFAVTGYQLAPKISYLFSKSTSWDLFYEYQKKQNQIGNGELLSQNRLGTSFSYAGSKKFTFNGELSLYQNKFNGNEFSAVGFQMLEGLQTGQNVTWRALLQKNITSFLDINLNYQGRKSERNATIHTGNVQLRAYF
ncbi:hypothetical protein KBJ98_01360 [Flavobacterium sp. F-328]|uniref:Uncharacterized protein n=1 Tax=Flavobacterium erciyesense TaxID=2825842 RepID=A0ABS5CZZ4_9FLAO|nr:hypothetical protein [Flavobacterium erciyesense]MBQ0907345.1 hypothetical protein [Flavobacterium erciyesense]